MSLESGWSPPSETVKDRYDALVEKMLPFRRFPQVEMAVTRSKSISSAELRLKFLASRLHPFFEDLGRKAKWEGGELPVDPQTFVEDPYYLNQGGVMWPAVMEEFVEANSGRYVEAVLTGGIGVGKSTFALWTTAYQVYRLSRLLAPQRDFGISPTDEIMFVFQSVSKDLAKTVDFARFKELIKASPYFQNHFKPKVFSEIMIFPKGLQVKALSGANTAALGQNVFGGFMDEVNDMAVVEKSKMARDGQSFNQAWANYNTIIRRRQSRFMRGGITAGMFCLVSSKKYPGDFTEKKAKEAATNPLIFVYDKKLWDVAPETNPDGSQRWTGQWFRVFSGDVSRKPRFLLDDEKVPAQDEHLVVRVPMEFKPQFEENMLGSLRDIAGVSTAVLHPFVLDKEAIADCFGKKPSLLSLDRCDFVSSQLGIVKSQLQQLHRPRFAHIDLALSGDSAGIACGYCDKFIKMNRGDHQEILPVITFDFVLEINPPKDGEINFAKIRAVIYKLTELGVPVRWVSLDSYQSVDTIQILRGKGYQSETRSVDVSTLPYDVTKQALLDRRLILPEHLKAQSEISELEFDTKLKKIDHPPQGSKDCADAIASVVFGLTMMTETWTGNKVSIHDAPAWLKQVEQQTRNKNSNEGRIGEAA